MKGSKLRLKFYQAIGIATIPSIGALPISSCGTNHSPVKEDCLISVINADFNCSLSTTSTKSKQSLDLTIDNNDPDTWEIAGVDEIKNGDTPLVQGQYVINEIENTKIVIHFGSNIITDDIKIALILQPHIVITQYDVNVLTPGAQSTIKSVDIGESLVTQILPISDQNYIQGIQNIQINKQNFENYEFDPDTSTLKIDKQYIVGNIDIRVSVKSRFFRVIPSFEEGQTDYVHFFNLEAELNKEYLTDMEIIPGYNYDYAFNNITITIQGKTIDPSLYSFDIDSKFPYKAKLKVNPEVVTDNIYINISLAQRQINSCFVYLFDGLTKTELSKTQFLDTTGYREDMSILCTDKTKYVDNLVVYSRDKSGNKTQLDEQYYSFIDGILTIYSFAPRQDNFFIELFFTCNESTTIENDSWENLCYYSSYPWERFLHIYPATKVNGYYYVGKQRTLLVGEQEYRVTIIGELFNNLADTSTPEGKKAFLTFEFNQVYGDDLKYAKYESGVSDKNLNKRIEWKTDNYESNIRSYLNTGDFYKSLPAVLKNGVKSVNNWYPLEYNEALGYTKGNIVADKFFILNQQQVNANVGGVRPEIPLESAFPEGQRQIYPWYADAATAVKRRKKDKNYWLSGIYVSPKTPQQDAVYFDVVCIKDQGQAYDINFELPYKPMDYKLSVVPCFCL